jgi:7-cyano-7-deazaguanine synthase
MANLATKMTVQKGQGASSEGREFTIHTPLIHLTKAQIIQRGASLGVDYGMTHSCYDPDTHGRACGHCDSCLLRKKGFAAAGVKDPTVYV